MTRIETLYKAGEIVTGSREQDYGSPENNFDRIAKFWNAYLNFTDRISKADVAAMLALLKIARIAVSPDKVDNWVDLAGYAACGCEIETMATEDCEACKIE